MAMKAVGWLSGKLGVDISGHGTPNNNNNNNNNYGQQQQEQGAPLFDNNMASQSHGMNAPHGYGQPYQQQPQHQEHGHHHSYNTGTNNNNASGTFGGPSQPPLHQQNQYSQPQSSHQSPTGTSVSGFYAANSGGADPNLAVGGYPSNAYNTNGPHQAQPQPYNDGGVAYPAHAPQPQANPVAYSDSTPPTMTTGNDLHSNAQHQHHDHLQQPFLQNSTNMGPSSPLDESNSSNNGNNNNAGAGKLWGTFGAKVGGWVSKEKLQTLTQKVGTGVAKVNQGMSGMGKLVFGDDGAGPERGGNEGQPERDIFGNVISAENGHSAAADPSSSGRTQLTGALDMRDADENGLPGTRNWYVYDKENKRWTVSDEAPDSVKQEYYAKLKEAEDERNGVKKYVPPPPPPPSGGMPPQHAPIVGAHSVGGAPRLMYAQNEFFGAGGVPSGPYGMPHQQSSGYHPQAPLHPQYFNPSAVSTQQQQPAHATRLQNEALFVPTITQAPQQILSVTSTTSQMGSPPPLGSVQSPSVPFPPPAVPSFPPPFPQAATPVTASPTASLPLPPPSPRYSASHAAPSAPVPAAAIPTLASTNTVFGNTSSDPSDPFGALGSASDEAVPMVPAAATSHPLPPPPPHTMAMAAAPPSQNNTTSSSNAPAPVLTPPRVPTLPFALPQVPAVVSPHVAAGAPLNVGPLPAAPKFAMPPPPPSFPTLPPAPATHQ